MAIITDIRDQIVEAVKDISVVGGYNTDNVSTAKQIISTPKLNAEQRRAHFGIEIDGKTNAKRGNATRSDVRFTARVIMDNTVDEAFWGFIEDIEAAVEMRFLDYYKYGGLSVNFDSVIPVKKDEVDSDRIREADLTISVSYSYSQSNLSGPVNP